MKKIIALFAAIAVMVTAFSIMPLSAAAAGNDNPLYQNRLKALGVLDGEIDPDKVVTRGRLADLVSRMFYVDEAAVDIGQVFSDVPPEHEYYMGVTQAYLSGAIKGDTEGTFRPDVPVTFAEMAKVFVSLIGYQVVAEEKGGYPAGYWRVASQKQMISSMAVMDAEVTMGSMATAVYETLDASVMETWYTDSELQYRENPDHTLMNDLKKRKKIDFARGIVTSDGVTYIGGPQEKKEDTAYLDGVEYTTKDFDISPLVGRTVEYWYTTDDMAGSLVYAYEYADYNKSFTYLAEDIDRIDINEVTVRENNKAVTKKFSDKLCVVYNAQGLEGFSAEDLRLGNGTMTLLDNNQDGSIDVVFLNQKNSYVVEGSSNKGYNIKYKLYDGQTESGLYIDETDDTLTYIVKDSGGKVISPSEIGMGSVVSVFRSRDGKVVTVIVTKSIIDGVVEQTRENLAYVTVMGTEYETAKQPDGSLVALDIKIGEAVSLYLDEDGRIVYADNSGSSTLVYAYIIAFANTRTFEDNWAVKAAVAGNLGSITNSQYYWVRDKLVQNESIQEYPVSSKLSLDGTRYKADEIGGKLAEYKNEVVTLELNAAGEVKKMEKMTPVFEYTSGGYDHNTQSMSQPDLSVPDYDNPAILLSGGVKGLVIPSKDDSERDNYKDVEYLSKYRIENGKKTHKVAVYDIPEGSQTPKLIALKEQLTEAGTAQGAADKGIITAPISNGLTEDGDNIYYAEYLNANGSVSTATIRADVEADKVWSMKQNLMDIDVGDIVEFSKDSAGDVISFKVVASSNDPIQSNLVDIGKLEKLERNSIWNENNGSFFHIFHYVKENGEKKVQGINVDYAVFRYLKGRDRVEQISVGEVAADISLKNADTVMVASGMVVVIAD